MSRYSLAPAAEADLDAIWEYIAEDSLDAADRWIAKLFETFDLLAQTPGMGHLRQDLTHLPLLFWPVGSYLILYRRQAESIAIVAVAQGSRDIPLLLRQRDRR